jgi:heme exporter protein C
MTPAISYPETASPPVRSKRLWAFTALAFALFLISTLANFLYPGTETSMGEVQRVFYIHLGSFAGAFLTFTIAVFAGLAYLRTRQTKWDHLGVASVEVGLGLSAVTIVTGAVWARPIWGTFWTWDPRLSTIAIMWLTYAAYLFLRAALEDPEQKRRFCAVYGILAFGSVLLTVVIIRIRPDAIHPVVAGPSVTSTEAVGDFNLSPRIAQTVLLSMIAYLFVSIALLWHRVRLEERAEQIYARKAQALSRL